MTSNHFLLAGLLFCLTFGTCRAGRHALLIGIGNYPAATNYEPVYGHRDAANMHSYLLTQNFSPEKIQLLRNEQASKRNILVAFQRLQQQLQPDDLLVVYFSGHGIQLCDDNGDEDDEIDEALLPYFDPTQGDLITESVLRDEELAQILLGFRQQIGAQGHLLLLMEACHAGGLDRAGSATAPDLTACNSTPTQLSASDWDFVNTPSPTSIFAPQIALFSSSAAEKSFADASWQSGLFTTLLIQCLSESSSKNTYQSLLHQVVLQVQLRQATQTPQLLGAPSDMLIFGSGVIPQIRRSANPEKAQLTPLPVAQLAQECRELSHHSPSLQLRAMLISNSTDSLPPTRKTDTLGVGQRRYLRVENTGSSSCYFSILDITSNDKIRLLFPRQKPAVLYHLAPGEVFVSPRAFRISPPTGLETLKLVASAIPLPVSAFQSEQSLLAHLQNWISAVPTDTSISVSSFTFQIVD